MELCEVLIIKWGYIKTTSPMELCEVPIIKWGYF